MTNKKRIRENSLESDIVYVELSEQAKDELFPTDEYGNPLYDSTDDSNMAIYSLLEEYGEPMLQEICASPEDGPSPNDIAETGVFKFTISNLKKLFSEEDISPDMLTIGDSVKEVVDEESGEVYAEVTDIYDDVFSLVYDSLDESITKIKESVVFRDLEKIANDLAKKLESAGIEVESISKDYFEDVRCWHISTGNLNAFIVGGPFKDIINSFIDKWDPEIAVEFEQGNNYFYGQDIYLMLGNEYYLD